MARCGRRYLPARLSRSSWRPLAAGLLVLAVVGAACGGGGSDSGSSGSSSSSGSGQASSSIKGGPEESSAGSKPPYTPTGPLVADSGFRPDANGFAFPNYGNDGPPAKVSNLTPVEMQRAFGNAVCANMTNGCTLTPVAQQWMDSENAGMAGGHCYGFSVASMSFYKSNPPPSQFGSNSTPTLDPNNQDLQREVAFDMAAQSFPLVRTAEIHGTPSDILDKTMAALNSEKDPNSKVVYSLGIFRRTQPYAGHAITPYAVEDKGNGQFAILVYDNNYPKSPQAVMVDKNANTWSYNGSPNPNEPSGQYEGDANTMSPSGKPGTLELDPADLSAQQPCPFCAAGGPGASTPATGTLAAASGPTYNEVYLESQRPGDRGHVLITDDQGRKTGYTGGQYVNEIPGVVIDPTFADQDWLVDEEPTYDVPTGMKVTLTVDGAGLKSPDTENLTVTGPATALAVNDIELGPNQQDSMVLGADGQSLSYKTAGNETPAILLGTDGTQADYGFSIRGSELGGGGQVNVGLDTAGGKLNFDTEGASHTGNYSIAVTRDDSQNSQRFNHTGISLEPGDHASFDYGTFQSNGQSINLTVDHNGTQRQETLTDQSQ